MRGRADEEYHLEYIGEFLVEPVAGDHADDPAVPQGSFGYVLDRSRSSRGNPLRRLWASMVQEGQQVRGCRADVPDEHLQRDHVLQ